MHPKNAVVVQLLLPLVVYWCVTVCVATKDLWALPALLGSSIVPRSMHTGSSANQTSRRLYMALGAVCCGPAGIDPNDPWRKGAWEKPRQRLLRV
jgi:hypothetical protein